MSRGSGDTEGPLSRWSRLKRARAEQAEPQPAEEAAQAADEAPAPEKTDAELLEELGLPEPDTLRPGDDIKGFMAEAVPARLRNRALRKLWTSDPVLANLDELLDYGEDFTDAAKVVDDLASAWQAGRGYLTEPEPPEAVEPEAARPEDAPEEADPEAEAGNAPADDSPSTALESPQEAPDGADPAPPAPRPAPASASAEAPAPGPRRMRFRKPGAA